MSGVRKTLAVKDGTVLSYQTFDGAGPAVVILHGLAGSGQEFVPTARALSPRRVILPDQRGHGFSTRHPTDTSRESFVSDVVALIQAEEDGPVDLVGQSMGAHTAMLVTGMHPELVRRLVLLECDEGSGTPDDTSALGEFFRSWEVPYPTREAAGKALGGGPLAQAWARDLEEREDGFHPRFEAEVMERISCGLRVPRRAEWEQVSAPTLVLYADGGMFTEEQKARFVAGRRNVLRCDLQDASHDAHLDAFEQWIGAVQAFVSSGGQESVIANEPGAV